MIIGAGMNHWYHQDMGYRSIINMLMMSDTVGVSGGGWAHYVGQKKLRPQTGWTMLAFALDWARPLRRMNGTSFFYAIATNGATRSSTSRSFCRRLPIPRPIAVASLISTSRRSAWASCPRRRSSASTR